MKNYAIGLAFALLFVCSARAQGATDLAETVRVQQGTLKGAPRDAQGVLSFRGVPFAAAPVGKLRWRPPESAAAWEGTRDASRVGNRCWNNVPETGLGGRVAEIPQSEDCLFLNVWTAASSSSERRPVMVWIHGGGFQFGTGRDPRTDGALLARKGVVVVSLHYRLGVFGFFSHPQLRTNGLLSGNFGLLDQIEALKWVQANIASFGGDPANVTIFGESSGSQSVSLMMGSPLAKGLFHRAIGQSGSSLQQLPTLAELSLRGAAYATAAGARSIDDLRAMPAERINAAAAWDFAGGAPIIFAPGIDGRVLPANMDAVYGSGRQNDVPLLAGYNKAEEFPFLAETLPHRSAAEFEAAAQNVFGVEKMTEFRSLYPSGTDADSKTSAAELLGDIRQRAETWRWLETHTKTGKSPAYGYVLSYESPYSPIASHGADMPFVFGNLVPQFFAPRAAAAGPADRKLADAMMSYWVNFATKGDPNGPTLAAWPEFRSSGSAMLQIREDGSFASSPPSDRQVARFRFLDGFLTSASLGQK
ncbi:carboxylesterase family protein [soil metagenome]